MDFDISCHLSVSLSLYLLSWQFSATHDKWHQEKLSLLVPLPNYTLHPVSIIYIYISFCHAICSTSLCSSSQSHLSIIIVISRSATRFEEPDNRFKMIPCCHNVSERQTGGQTRGVKDRDWGVE